MIMLLVHDMTNVLSTDPLAVTCTPQQQWTADNDSALTSC